jgi:hypothetical protein
MRLIKIVKTPQLRVGVLQLTLLVHTASRRRRSLVHNQIRPSVIGRTLIDNRQNSDKMNTADNDTNICWQSRAACTIGLAEFLRLASRFIQYNTCNYKDQRVSKD